MKKILFILLILLMGCSQTPTTTPNPTPTTTESKLILSVDGNKVVTAPEDYDRDAHDSFKDQIIDMELSDDVVIYETYKETIIYEDGEEEVVNETSKELTKQEFVDLFEYGSVAAHLEISNDKIIKLTVWGELTIWK